MNTIICPTDFTRPSNNALSYALKLAEKTGGKIILLHAYEIPIVYNDVGVANLYVLPADIKVAAEKRLLGLRKRLIAKNPGTVVEAVLMPGLASDKIVQVASEKKAGLIVMSSSSTGTMERLLVGSNTGRVINNTPCPLIVVPPKAKFKDVKTILFSTDLKEENLAGADQVTVFARQFDASVKFLYVNTHLLEKDEDEIELMTGTLRDQLKYSKITGFVCNDTDVDHGISYFISKNPVDLLCMITHHRSFLEGLWNRSMTKKMAGHITIPLLVLQSKIS